MSYDPTRPDREYHVANLALARRTDAPWHRLAEIFRNGLRVPPETDPMSVGQYMDQAAQRTGIAAEDLIRMVATLERVEFFAHGRRAEKFLSDDIEAVEAATRIAWHDPSEGLQILQDLKHGGLANWAVFAVLETKERSAMPAPKPPKSPHSHWSHYDERLEMLEFDRLHAILAHGERVQAPDYDRLVRLARSAGYADADSFVTAHGLDGSDDTPQVAAEREQFENYMDGDYWNQIDRSQNLLQAIGADGATREAADRICQAMRDAYEKGREHRLHRDAPSVPKP